MAGLGNPGSRYAHTRHNVGFWFVERLAARERTLFRMENKFYGETCGVAQADYRLLKPGTFMNRSGQSVAALMRYYDIRSEQVLVVHDDLDLPPGAARLKNGGGHGGHNGLRDIVRHLGENSFLRLRLGIGHPGHRNEVTDYVLHHPSVDEHNAIDLAIDAALTALSWVIDGDLDKAMNRLHTGNKERTLADST
ncbi:MAG: aminoacyl-tRNA hydrolase [Gammaproteobacteria bacterium]|nr:aminoacyl-tRNA hydrolase [Gammaproteobacteria bacterium]